MNPSSINDYSVGFHQVKIMWSPATWAQIRRRVQGTVSRYRDAIGGNSSFPVYPECGFLHSCLWLTCILTNSKCLFICDIQDACDVPKPQGEGRFHPTRMRGERSGVLENYGKFPLKNQGNRPPWKSQQTSKGFHVWFGNFSEVQRTLARGYSSDSQGKEARPSQFSPQDTYKLETRPQKNFNTCDIAINCMLWGPEGFSQESSFKMGGGSC